MFCSKCGSPLDDGDKFCSRCGTPVKTEDIKMEDELATSSGLDETTYMGTTEPIGTEAFAPMPTTPESSQQEMPPESVPEASTTNMGDYPVMPPTQQMPQVTPMSSSTIPPTSAPGFMGAPTPQNPANQPTKQSVPWYMTTPARIALGVFGVILIISGIMKIAGGLGNSNEPEPETPPVVQPKQGDDAKDKTEGKTDGKTDETSTTKSDSSSDDNGDHDIIIADDDDIVIADDNDVVIRNPSGGATGTDGGEKYDSWADECVNDDGHPTAYAIAELKGWQLETLCQEKGLTWNKGSKQWEADGYALVVYDENHERIDDEEIAKLGKGASESGVVYEIQSKRHPKPEDAYKSYVSGYVVSEDFVNLSKSAWLGAAYGPSMTRMLVPVYEGTVVDYSMTQIVPEGSIKDGSYDKFDKAEEIVGKSYGSSVPEVFETKARRKLGAEH